MRLLNALKVLLVCSALISCSSNPTPKFTGVKTFTISVEVVEELKSPRTGKPIHGLANTRKSGECHIKIDKGQYTHACLGHELRHCLDGYWHDNRPTPCHRQY